MDNVTHTLIGVTLAKALPRKTQGATRAVLWTAVIGSNLPDFDFVHSLIAGGGKLAYLLHHRGHTHTLLFTLVGGVIAAVAGARIAKIPVARWPEFFLLGWVACLLHILADFGNNYGVHPFAPFSNRWFYGDAIFIIEPLIWFALLPLAFSQASSRFGRIAPPILWVGMLALLWAGPFMHWPLALGVTVWALVVGGLQLRYRGVAVAVAASLAVVSVFAFQSWKARQTLASELETQAPIESVRQLVVTPAPANPWCWEALAVGQILDERYIVRTGTISLAPRFFDPARCYPRMRLRLPRTAPLTDATLRSSASIRWGGEYRASLAAGRKLQAESCAFRQFLGFARVPYWSKDPRAVGDLRYDFEPELGFAELDPDDRSLCLKNVPGWMPPTPLAPPF